MTEIQLKRLDLIEKMRTNRANEDLKNDQNVETHRDNVVRATETGRHNRITENETSRHNLASEDLEKRGQNTKLVGDVFKGSGTAVVNKALSFLGTDTIKTKTK